MKKNIFIAALALFLATLAVTLYFFQQRQRINRIPLSISTTCIFSEPLKSLSRAFEKEEWNVKIETIINDSASLVRSIKKQDIHPDLFISPGEKEIWLLSKQGLLDENLTRTFGQYALVLVTASDAREINKIDDLFKDSIKKFAIVNPDYNSIGAYSIIALTKLGYWDKIQQTKLIMFTNTPMEALSFIATHKADAGIHFGICPFKINSKKIPGGLKIFGRLPDESHPPINNYIAVLKESKNKELAKKFIDFIFSSKGQKVLAGFGLDEKSKTGFNQEKAKIE